MQHVGQQFTMKQHVFPSSFFGHKILEEVDNKFAKKNKG